VTCQTAVSVSLSGCATCGGMPGVA
jgi:hypothetical protein